MQCLSIYLFFCSRFSPLSCSPADLANGVVPENGLQFPEPGAGKKHKRHKNPSRLVDGKFESVALEKENIGVTQTENHLREQVKVLNNHNANNG